MQQTRLKITAAVLAACLLTAACHRRMTTAEQEPVASVPVTVTGITVAPMNDYLTLMATSVFLNKAMVKATATGYVEEAHVTVGQNVTKGQDLFILKTKEAAAIGTDTLGHATFPGLITVRTAIDGTVLSIDHPAGDYVLDGDRLAVIAVPGSLVFILEAPFEDDEWIKTGAPCDVILPGGRTMKGVIASRLPAVTGNAQTQQYIIRMNGAVNLPENLIAQVKILKLTLPGAIMLPRACVLADALMKHFWVMKLINDSTAVKVSVTTGLTHDDSVQIVHPAFTPSDLILASGNYGLGDTATVAVIKNIMTGK
jgi:hypothetical protein